MNSGLALEFCADETLNNHAVCWSRLDLLICVIVCYFTKMLLTAMMFLVRVPVLSEHILSAPPIVSHACKYLTKLFSSFILPTE